MIISSEKIPGFVQTVERLSRGNPFACRIISLYRSYSPDLAFVDYWITADAHGVCTGAIARNGSAFILFLTSQSDLHEISSFLRLSGARGILCDGNYKLELFGEGSTGTVMRLSRLIPLSETETEAEIIKPDLRSAYELMRLSADENFTPPTFDDFYVDVNHKLRHQTARICGAADNGQLVAFAMTVAECDRCAVLGAVVCHPDYRRKGYGTQAVRSLIKKLISEGKTVYIHRARNTSASFYVKMGFTDYGYWKEYRL